MIPIELLLCDEIVRLINHKRRRIALAKRRMLKAMDRGEPNFNVTPRRAV
jgi:hypothetical protein